ncbi:MAG: hypothetical protein ACRD2R_03430, partial [Terriglobales bacterium]
MFALALLAGALRAWALRGMLRGDSISYLDIAQAYARGDWASAISTFWSPLYPWILALVLRLFHPSPESEYTAVSLLGLVFYFALLLAFLFLWRSLEETADSAGKDSKEEPPLATHAIARLVLGYAIFFWGALQLLRIGPNLADQLLSVFVVLAAAFLVRLRRPHPRLRDYAALGAVLALGYLAKAVLFPLVPIFLVTAALAPPPGSRSRRGVVMAAAVFLALALPWIAVLSRHAGRFTWSDTGPLNYAWIINRAPMFNWQGHPPGTGTPVHPTRRIFDVPAAYEFASPVPGTYPYWYDPTYWNQGLRPHLDVQRTW